MMLSPNSTSFYKTDYDKAFNVTLRRIMVATPRLDKNYTKKTVSRNDTKINYARDN